MKYSIPAIQISFVFILFTSVFFTCKKSDLSSVISPARSIEGTWNTPLAVKLFLSTDKCGGFVRFAEQNQKLSWNIVSVSDNQVIIYSNATYKSNFTIYTVCSQQPVPVSYDLASSMTGVISSSRLDLFVGNIKVGSMNMTTNNLAGYYDRKICDSYSCSGLSSDPGTLILTK